MRLILPPEYLPCIDDADGFALRVGLARPKTFLEFLPLPYCFGRNLW